MRSLILAASLLVAAAPAFAQDDYKSLPPGPGRDVTVRVCAQCHSPEIVSSQTMDAQGWKDLVNQMANNGDGNISVISDSSFMATYWTPVKLFYQDLAAYGKPALVNLEPDFWGYAEQHSTGGDPTKLAAIVTTNPDCTALPSNSRCRR